MFYYSAYNFTITSDIPLPELPCASSGEDLRISLAPAAPAPVPPRSIDWHESPAHEAFFYFPRVAQFQIRDGSEIGITPDPNADPSIFHLYIQGMMLASALHQRGYFVLHASVIDVEGPAIAIMGPIGAGKSTFASAFHARGYRILADDNAAIDLEETVPRVLPAFPSLKVYPEVAGSLGHSSLSLRRMHQSQIKQALSVAGAFSTQPLPLAIIYLLDRDAAPGIARVSPIDAITELIRHSVPTRWGVAGNPRHLKMCASLARRVPIFRVRTFTELAEIPAIAAQMERHSSKTEPVCTA